ncbi:Uncharacterised protein [Vibrio cholerae]|nr:Uncharacterised protein [Vibrio cholerae]
MMCLAIAKVSVTLQKSLVLPIAPPSLANS